MSPEAKQLMTYMSEPSERAYSAGWMEHLEYVLWHAIINGPMRYGRLEITSGEIDELQRLRHACGGWIYFDDTSGETWLPIQEWQDLFTTNIDLVQLSDA